MARADVSELWRDASQSVNAVRDLEKVHEAIVKVQTWLKMDSESEASNDDRCDTPLRLLAAWGLGGTVISSTKDLHKRISAARLQGLDRAAQNNTPKLERHRDECHRIYLQLSPYRSEHSHPAALLADTAFVMALSTGYILDSAERLRQSCHNGRPQGKSSSHYHVPLYSRLEPMLHTIMYAEIQEHIYSTYRHHWTQYDIPSLARDWLLTNRYPYVIDLIRSCHDPDSADAAMNNDELVQSAVARFDFHIFHTVLRLRISELFDIIVDWPDSRPAVMDTKACLLKVEGRNKLCSGLAESMRRRLLHPGADTKDILDHYVRTIRALRTIDPPGVLLAVVAEPVRTYLRSRQDAIRCIMTAMMDEESLWTDGQDEARIGFSSKDEEDNYRDPQLLWEPDPTDAPSYFRRDRSSDIAQMLTSIYDTKDVFVKEFQHLLASRLLQLTDYEIEKELRHVEILKKRFGESLLQGCEIMLKDMVDSKRVDNNVKERLHRHGAASTHALIVSKLFWPTLISQAIRLPSSLQQRLLDYENAFNRYKPDKRIRWLRSLGIVKIHIRLEDRDLVRDVTPSQAAVLQVFVEKARWSLSEIQMKLESESSSIQSALYYWSDQGVLREESSAPVWIVLERAADVPAAPMRQVDNANGPAEMARTSDEIARFRMHWSYIEGILKNLGPQQTSRIHSYLTKFLPNYRDSGGTEANLDMFMEQLQREGAVEVLAGGDWRLTKNF